MSALPTRPLLRYFGGKWQLRHWIIQHLPKHAFYAEPFAGAASVLLAKAPAPKGEILNDLNRETINLFRVMQDAAKAADLQSRLDWTPYSAAELTLSREPTDDPVERARPLEQAGWRRVERDYRANMSLTRRTECLWISPNAVPAAPAVVQK